MSCYFRVLPDFLLWTSWQWQQWQPVTASDPKVFAIDQELHRERHQKVDHRRHVPWSVFRNWWLEESLMVSWWLGSTGSMLGVAGVVPPRLQCKLLQKKPSFGVFVGAVAMEFVSFFKKKEGCTRVQQFRSFFCWIQGTQVHCSNLFVQRLDLVLHTILVSCIENGCFQKQWYPKMDGENNGKPYFLMDDLGEKTPYFWKHPNPSNHHRNTSNPQQVRRLVCDSGAHWQGWCWRHLHDADSQAKTGCP